MTDVTMIGWVVVSLITILALVSWINKPFKERDEEIKHLKKEMYKINNEVKSEVRSSNNDLIRSLNDLTTTMKLMNLTLEGFQETFKKQDDFNEEIEMEIQQIKDDFKDFKHQCDKVHYYKQREP